MEPGIRLRVDRFAVSQLCDETNHTRHANFDPFFGG